MEKETDDIQPEVKDIGEKRPVILVFMGIFLN